MSLSNEQFAESTTFDQTMFKNVILTVFTLTIIYVAIETIVNVFKYTYTSMFVSTKTSVDDIVISNTVERIFLDNTTDPTIDIFQSLVESIMIVFRLMCVTLFIFFISHLIHEICV